MYRSQHRLIFNITAAMYIQQDVIYSYCHPLYTTAELSHFSTYTLQCRLNTLYIMHLKAFSFYILFPFVGLISSLCALSLWGIYNIDWFIFCIKELEEREHSTVHPVDNNLTCTYTVKSFSYVMIFSYLPLCISQ